MAGTGAPGARHKFFIAVICLLAAIPIAKIGDIQLLEIFLFLHLLWLGLALAYNGFRLRLNGLWRQIGGAYAIFFIAVLTFALASLRFRFYQVQPEFNLLKLPFVLSIARSVEIFLGVFYMLYVATILQNDRETQLYAVRFYFWTGFGTAVYSLLSVPLYFSTGLTLGIYFPAMRARGLFNEGGPYGTYLISIMVTGLVLHRTKGLTTTQLFFAASTIAPVFFMTQSKAAILACLILFTLNLVIVGSFRLRATLVLTASIVAVGVLTLTTFTNDFMGYVTAYELVQEGGSSASEGLRGGFGGRLAGAILVPRMVAAHPWTGVGIGNYPILFNDPNYLQGLPYTSNWEAPSIGIAGYVADLGIPLFLYLILLLCVPTWFAYRRKSAAIIFAFCAVAPLVQIFGVQLNWYYPWICSGLALSMLDFKKAPKKKRLPFFRIMPAPIRHAQASSRQALGQADLGLDPGSR